MTVLAALLCGVLVSVVASPTAAASINTTNSTPAPMTVVSSCCNADVKWLGEPTTSAAPPWLTEHRAAHAAGLERLEPSFGVAAEAGAGADNVVNGLRRRAQLTGDEIAGGHAVDKHVTELGEFPGITTRGQFARTIEDVVTNGEMRSLSGGRTAYWNDGTVVIPNPGAADGGTAFRRRTAMTTSSGCTDGGARGANR